MVVRAYVLTKVKHGRGERVMSALRNLRGVESADLVTGPYDIIAVVEAMDLNEIADLVTGRILTVPEVTSTTTCLAIKTM